MRPVLVSTAHYSPLQPGTAVESRTAQYSTVQPITVYNSQLESRTAQSFLLRNRMVYLVKFLICFIPSGITNSKIDIPQPKRGKQRKEKRLVTLSILAILSTISFQISSSWWWVALACSWIKYRRLKGCQFCLCLATFVAFQNCCR